jgi:hypothetical protein
MDIQPNFNANSSATPPAQPFGGDVSSQLPPPKKSKKKLWIIIGVVIVLFLGFLTFNVMRVMKTVNDAKSGKAPAVATGDNAAAYKLYDALGNAVGSKRSGWPCCAQRMPTKPTPMLANTSAASNRR